MEVLLEKEVKTGFIFVMFFTASLIRENNMKTLWQSNSNLLNFWMISNYLLEDSFLLRVLELV